MTYRIDDTSTFPGCAHVPTQYPPRRIDRRALLKATAALMAMATVAPAAAPSTTVAQADSTQAGEWHQPDGVGGASEFLAFEADFPFNAVAPHWPGDTPFPAVAQMQLSMDGQTWSDPVTVGPAHTDAGPVDRDGRIFADLLLTEEATMVRYLALDVEGNTVAIPGLTFTYINAKAGPRISDVSSPSLNPSPTRPPIISRGDWGAERAYGGVDRGTSEWTPEYQTVRHIIIHHSETPSFRDPLVEIRSIHYYHAVTRGWGDIGYNYLVDFLGNVYEGRAGGENVIGGHAFQYAQGSAGICSMGAFSFETSTPEAIAGLTWITAWAARNLDPLSRRDFHETPNLPTICGHRDVVNSVCPGDGLYADLPTIRWAVADVIAGAREVLNDPDYSPGETVETTVEDGNLRSLPGSGQTVAATLPAATVMHVMDGPTTVDGYSWYQLTGNPGTGWMATSVFTASDAAPPVGQFSVGDRVEVDTDYLNIRTDPSLRVSALATMPRGTGGSVVEGPVPAGGYRWYRLETDYGTGWVVEQYLAAEGAATLETWFVVGDAVAVNDPDGLRLRTGAGLGTSIIATLPDGTRGVVVSNARMSDDINWLEVQTAIGTGWLAASYLVASTSGPTSEARFQPGDVVRVDTDLVNLREGAGTGEPVIMALGNGISGTVVDGPVATSNLYWIRVDTDYGTGWMAEAFLASADAEETESSRSFDIGDTVYIDTDGINIRTSPGTSSDVVSVLYTNETAMVVDGPRTADGYVWYRLDAANGTGWGVSRYLGLGTADPAGSSQFGIGDIVAVDTDGINLRSEPGLSGARVMVLYADQQATVIDGPRNEDGYNWLKLDAGSESGWVVAYLLRREASAGLAPGITARVFGGELNLREAPGTGSSVIGALADGAYVDILDGPESADGYDWVRVNSSRFGSGWCVADFLARA
ncbi:MAG: SH3 domain-containing protein [Chloroflexota bacterium]|nr:SH3 domain-containing protein [Chloroflexota bacterium]